MMCTNIYDTPTQGQRLNKHGTLTKTNINIIIYNIVITFTKLFTKSKII